MIVRRPLGHQIADELRMDIISGVLPTGQRLTQEAICARFETSRMPVRDAVQILSYEGLVRATPTGIVITGPTETDFEDMLRIEALLHSLATELATRRATDEELGALAELNDRALRLMEDGDNAEAIEANFQFHRSINHLSQSPRLSAAIRGNSVRSHGQLIKRPHRTSDAVHDHLALIKAMRDRQAGTAFELMLAHMTQINRAMLDRRTNTGSQGPQTTPAEPSPP
jgi:DNA-binding GntR family transcriptional regulator